MKTVAMGEMTHAVILERVQKLGLPGLDVEDGYVESVAIDATGVTVVRCVLRDGRPYMEDGKVVRESLHWRAS